MYQLYDLPTTELDSDVTHVDVRYNSKMRKMQHSEASLANLICHSFGYLPQAKRLNDR